MVECIIINYNNRVTYQLSTSHVVNGIKVITDVLYKNNNNSTNNNSFEFVNLEIPKCSLPKSKFTDFKALICTASTYL